MSDERGVRDGSATGGLAGAAPLGRVVVASNNSGKLREFSAMLSEAGIALIAQGELGVP